MTFRTSALRAGIAATCAVACLAGAPAACSPAAADSTPAYFSRRLGDVRVHPQRVAVGADGSVYVAGQTWTFDLPGTVNPPTPTDNNSWYFLTAFSRDGTSRWTTYRRFDPTGNDEIRGLTVGVDGGVWLVLSQGWTSSYQTSPEPDGGRKFPVAKFTSDGDLAFVTAIGGTLQDTPYDIAPTADGDVVIVGTTASTDFPVVDAYQAEHGGGYLDGFVARVRGDGSGLAWSTYLGSSEFDGVTAVAIDGSGEIVVARDTRGPVGESWTRILTWDPVAALDLVRLTADGNVVSETPLPHAERGGVFSLAVEADGSVVAGGNGMYGWAGIWGGLLRGYVTRIAPGAVPPFPLWRADGFNVRRIGAGPSGEIAVELDRSGYPDDAGSVVLLDESLQPVRTLRAEHERGDLLATALGADGTLCAVGRGRELLDPALGPGLTRRDAFVSTTPLSGAAPPPSVEVRRERERSFDVTWPDGGDPVIRYEIEHLAGEGDDLHFELLTTAPADARSVRLDDLLPGRTYSMRLVSVFASGARSAVTIPAASTRPRPITNVRAAAYDGLRIRVTWDRGPTWPLSDVQIERQLGDGEFRRIPSTRFESWPFGIASPNEFFDVLPPMEEVRVRYRVRAVTREGQLRTPWSYSNPVFTRPSSLVVRQTSGTVSRSNDGASVRTLVEGTYGRPNRTDDSASFDPRRDDLFITVGDIDRPTAVQVSPNSYLGHFHRRPGGWFRSYIARYDVECPQDQNFTPHWEIEIHPGTGRFRISASECAHLGVRPDAERIVVGLAYRNLAGGDVRTWTRLPGPAPSLVLR